MTLSESLRAAIETWIGRSKHNNYNALADKCGMPYATLYRIAKGESDKPQIDSVLSVLRVVLSKSERYVFLKEFYPAIAEDFSKENHFSDRSNVDSELSRPDVSELFKHRDGFLLGQHLLAGCGISTEKIQELYGQHGFDLVKKLDRDGSVTFVDGEWKIPTFYVAQDLESNLDQIRHSIDSFKAESIEVNAAYLRTLSNGVTLSAAQEIRQLLNACAVAIDKVATENPGDHVFLTNFATQLLDPKKAIEEQARVRGEKA